MAGILFAKFTKPTGRGETILFSKNALISLRNGVLYLQVRLGDLRPTHLMECHVSAHFLAKESTEEGEVGYGQHHKYDHDVPADVISNSTTSPLHRLSSKCISQRR